MNKFAHRSFQPELLDAPDIPKELLFQNLHELDFIDRILGGHRISLKGIKKLVTDKERTYHIVDLGCGSGDAMKYVAKWTRTKGYHVTFTGVDRNADAINFLKEHCEEYPEIKGLVSDYRDFIKSNTDIDIVHCALFCHHLNDEELLELIRNVKNNVKIGLVINDLHRHFIAYWGVYLIPRLLNGTLLAKNDGPISVLRAFKRKELQLLLQKAHMKTYTINWKWAFRYLVVGYI